MIIRKATRDDVYQMKFLIDHGINAGSSIPHDVLHMWFLRAQTKFVAVEGEQLVGQAFLIEMGEGEERFEYLFFVHVDRPHRGNGIGQSLVEACEDAAVQRGTKRMVLAVDKENYDAKRLWERLGYVVYADRQYDIQIHDDLNRIFRRMRGSEWLLWKEL